MKHSLNRAIEFDKNDVLKEYRDHFENDDNMIYLDGNSLGKLPEQSIELITDLVKDQWGNRLIRSWNENWIDLSKRIASKIARLVGAREDEIFIGDSTSLNLYKLAYAALKAKPNQHKIISDEFNFPADLYVLQGLIDQQFTGHSMVLMKSRDGISIDKDELHKLINEQTALITLSHVTYKSAFMYDMEQVNQMAHKNNSLVLWDLSHAVGSVDIELNKSNADMAVGCTYKYLNGGPGAPAFIYVRKDLQQKLVNPINSWFSHEHPFDFELNYQPSTSIQKFAVGTPNILSMAAIEPGLDVSLAAGISQIRKKSVDQTNYLHELIEEELVPLGFAIASPEDPGMRGSHISIQHDEAYRINRAMIEPADDSKVIIPDFRPPNNIRLGIAPLYTTFVDLHKAIQRIRAIVLTKEFENFGNDKLTVT